jgi:hypothetical protein
MPIQAIPVDQWRKQQAQKQQQSQNRSAMQQLNTLADVVQARTPGLTREKAIATALKESPDLYDLYLREHPAQL